MGAWADTANNEFVTFAAAIDSGIYQKEILPSIVQLMTRTDVMYFLDIDPSYLSSDDDELVLKLELVGYPGYATFNWDYVDDDANVGDFMSIMVEGYELVNVNSTSSGSFAIHEGDNVTVTVRTADNGYPGNSADMYIGGDNGLGYDLILDGVEAENSVSFVWHTPYHDTQVVCLIQNRTYVPPPPEYYNTEQSKAFWKDDCGSGYIGSLVKYTIPANYYLSHVSQANANWMAQKAIELFGQSNANAYGTCSLPVQGNLSYSFSDDINLHHEPWMDYQILKNEVIIVGTTGGSGSFMAQEGDLIVVAINTYIGSGTVTKSLVVQGNFPFYHYETSYDYIWYSFVYSLSYGEVRIEGTKRNHW